MKAISRSAGRSATGAAAYRAGCSITDQRTGEVHDYRRKGGVESTDLVLPEGVPVISREDLWNGVELHHRRGDALVAREFEVALPDELSAVERQQLAVDFARELANHYGVAADVCGHKPGRGGDDRNHHAHILISACSVTKDGFGKKVATLDPIHCQRQKIANPAELWRERWAEMTNERLQQNQIDAKVDHRSLKDQGIEQQPMKHLGPSATGFERRTGEASHKRRTHEAQAKKKAAEKKYQEWVDETRQAVEKEAAHLAGELAIAQAKHTAWEERNARRHAGTPNRIIGMDQTMTNDGRVLHRWAGAGPSAGKVAVIEKEGRLSAAGRYSRPKAAAMAQIADARGWKSVTITGNEHFKALALHELLRLGIEVRNPEMQQQVEAWRNNQAKAMEAKRQAEEAQRRTAEAERAQAKAAKEAQEAQERARKAQEEREARARAQAKAAKEAQEAQERARKAQEEREARARAQAKAAKEAQEAREGARKAQEEREARAREEEAKIKENTPKEPLIDYRAVLIAEVERMTEGRAQCFERDGIQSTGTVFAVNERFAAQDNGRLCVRIIDRTQIPVGLGTWTVGANGSLKAGQLRDGGRGLQWIYGKGVTEQLERAPHLDAGTDLGKGKGLGR
jgi:membrane protein involved in colicin uptake